LDQFHTNGEELNLDSTLKTVINVSFEDAISEDNLIEQSKILFELLLIPHKLFNEQAGGSVEPRVKIGLSFQ